MTKKELSQLYWLNREIEADKRKLEELRLAAVSATAKITGLPHVTGVRDKVGEIAVLIEEQSRLIELKKKQTVIEYNRLMRYINSVDDSLMRQILTLRYVNGLSWQQVAFAIGESDEQYPRRKHNKFLQSQQLDENDEQEMIE